ERAKELSEALTALLRTVGEGNELEAGNRQDPPILRIGELGFIYRHPRPPMGQRALRLQPHRPRLAEQATRNVTTITAAQVLHPTARRTRRALTSPLTARPLSLGNLSGPAPPRKRGDAPVETPD